MLGKLLKYEVPAMGRKILPLYAAWAVTALLLGLSTQSAESKSEFIVAISGLLYAIVATAILVMTVILIVQRYSNSLLGDEAYFNHVLPVSASAHIGNKLISATLWVFVTVLVAILTGLLIGIGALIVSGDKFSLSELIQSLMEAEFNFPKHFGLIVLEILILTMGSVVKTVMQIYAAITIGHQAANHTTLASIGAYILVLMFEAMVGRMIMPILISAGLNEAEGIMTITKVFFPALIVTLAFAAIYFFVCKYLMEKHLNLA